MKILIIIGIIAFIAFSIWYAKRNGVTAEYDSKARIEEISTNIDKPIDFGYKIVWIAVKTDNKIEIANILGLKTGNRLIGKVELNLLIKIVYLLHLKLANGL